MRPFHVLRSLDGVQTLTSLVLLWAVAAPLLLIFGQTLVEANSWTLLFRAEGASLRTATWTSLALSAATAILATAWAALMAAWTTRRRFALSRVTTILPLLPLTLPPLIGVMAFLFLFGDVGLFQGAWRAWIHDRPPGALTGFPAVLLVHVYSFSPLGYILLRDSFLALDGELDGAARSLGARRWNRWRTAWWPTLAPAMGGSLWLCFMSSMASFSAPYLLGGSGRYLSTEIVARRLGGQLEMARMETVLLAGLSLLLLMVRPATVKSSLGRPAAALRQAGWEGGLSSALALVLLLVTLLPHLTLLLLSFVEDGSWTHQPLPPAYTLANHLALFREGAAFEPLLRSFAMALPAVFVGAIWACLVARASLTAKRGWRSAAELAGVLPWAVPATALAMAWLGAYNEPTVAGFGLVLASTPWLLPWAYCLRFIPLQIRAVASALAARGLELEQAARTLGASPWRATLRVSLPMAVPALLGASALAFVLAAGEFVVSVLLYVPENRPVSLAILEKLRVFDLGGAAALGCWLGLILAAVVILVPNASRSWNESARS